MPSLMDDGWEFSIDHIQATTNVGTCNVQVVIDSIERTKMRWVMLHVIKAGSDYEL